jgi:hypothetical protein
MRKIAKCVTVLALAVGVSMGSTASVKAEAAGQSSPSVRTAEATRQQSQAIHLAQRGGGGDSVVCDWIQKQMWDAWWRYDWEALRWYSYLFYKYGCDKVAPSGLSG